MKSMFPQQNRWWERKQLHRKASGLASFFGRYTLVSLLIVVLGAGGLIAGVAFNSYNNETTIADDDELIFWDTSADAPHLKNITWDALKDLIVALSSDLLNDDTPQLGGDLDVNGNEIQSSGDVVVQLGDAAGSNVVEVEDSGGNTAASIDSDGLAKFGLLSSYCTACLPLQMTVDSNTNGKGNLLFVDTDFHLEDAVEGTNTPEFVALESSTGTKWVARIGACAIVDGYSGLSDGYVYLEGTGGLDQTADSEDPIGIAVSATEVMFCLPGGVETASTPADVTTRPTTNYATLNDFTANTGTKPEAVDEASSDGDTTYIYIEDAAGGQAFSNKPSLDSGTIQGVSVHVVAKYVGGATMIRPRIYVNGSTYSADAAEWITSSYAEYEFEWTTNPDTSATWTEADVEGTGSNDLEAWGFYASQVDAGEDVYVTQVWLEVRYN